MNEEKIVYTFGRNDCDCKYPCKCEPYAIFKDGERYALTNNRRNAMDITACLNESESRMHYSSIDAESEDIGKLIAGLHLNKGEILEIPKAKLKIKLRDLK
jgi:hypothetical protein